MPTEPNSPVPLARADLERMRADAKRVAITRCFRDLNPTNGLAAGQFLDASIDTSLDLDVIALLGEVERLRQREANLVADLELFGGLAHHLAKETIAKIEINGTPTP